MVIMDVNSVEIVFRVLDTLKTAIEQGRNVKVTADDVTINDSETVINALEITVE